MKNQYAKGSLFTSAFALMLALAASGVYDCHKAICACSLTKPLVAMQVQKTHELKQQDGFNSTNNVRADLSPAD